MNGFCRLIEIIIPTGITIVCGENTTMLVDIKIIDNAQGGIFKSLKII